MNGFQRFAVLVLCLLLAMIFYPHYTMSVWPFMAAMLGIWTIVIMVLSAVMGIFGLDRFTWLNRLVSILLVVAIVYSVLCYMPQEDGIKPITRLRQGQYPTRADIEKGIKRLTFNFDFNRRNARSDKNFINQQDEKKQPAPAPKPKRAPQQDQLLDIEVE